MLYIQENKSTYRLANEDEIIYEAISIYNRFFARGEALSSPDKARDMIKLKLARYEHEVFLCLFLDNQHKVISCEELFRGTIDAACVYPREVLKAALRLNASALIFAHNHPSGSSQPSDSDRQITSKLQQALSLVSIRVLDHFIIGESIYSFAEHGLV